MRSLLLVVFLTACGAAKPPVEPAPPPGREITLGARPWKNGEVRMRKVMSKTKLEAVPPTAKHLIEVNEIQLIREQPAGEYLRVTWVDRRADHVVDGVPAADPPNALVGRTFLIERRKGKTIVRDENGQPCDDEACRQAEVNYPASKTPANGEGNGPGKGLHRPIRVGEQVDDLAEYFLGGTPEGWRMSAAHMRLDHLESDDVAVFVTSAILEEPGTVRMDIEVETHSDIASGRELSANLKGTITVTKGTEKYRGPFSLLETITWR